MMSTIKFQTHECPMCKTVLRFGRVSGVTSYWCPNQTDGGKPLPHYEVESDGKQTIQHLYAFPYAIDNYANSTRSRVFKWTDGKWKLLKEVAHISARPQGELLAYLQGIAHD